MRLHAGFAVGLCLFLSLVARDALADKRVALVIGNSAYKHTSKLPNPVNDAAAVSALFKSAGFDVIESRQNLSGNEMRRTIRDFTDKVRDADIAVVFYAGHGIEIDGTNYLLPVDAALERDLDVEDEAIPLDRLVRMLDSAKRLRLVILDACRDNPFIQTMKRSSGTRSVGRGLAKIEPTSSDTLIAFAAKAGSTAADGGGSNSPFTMALVNNITTPGLDLRIAFGRVRDDVMKSTSNRQEPFVYGSLGGATVALVTLAEPPPRATITAPAPVYQAPASDPASERRRDYENAKALGTRAALESFLALHSDGFYADLARQQIEAIIIEENKKAKPQTAARPPEVPAVAPPASKTPDTPKTSDTPKPRSAEAPKSNNAPSGANRIVCGRSGCQEVKPGCVAVELKDSPNFQNWVVTCK